MKNTGNIVGALLVGAALGAIAGILLAPDKGSEVRKRIKTGAKDLGENFMDKFMKSFEEVKNLAESNTSENLEEFYHNVHSKSNPVETA